MPARFLDPATQQRFEHNGYVVIDLLDESAILGLLAAYNDTAPSSSHGFSATLRNQTFDQNSATSVRVSDIIMQALANHAIGYVPIGATFLTKGPGEGGALTLHQDWNSADERHSHSVNVWCALSDIDVSMGPLEVIPGSHRWFESVRSPTIPSVQVDFGPDIDELLVPLPIPIGSAVVYDHRLLHGSRDNVSDEQRVVAQVGMLPDDTDLIMCFPEVGMNVEIRRVGPDAFLRGFEYESDDDITRPGTVSSVIHAVPVTPADVVHRATAERRDSGLDRPPANVSQVATRSDLPAAAVGTDASERTGPRTRLRRLVRSICSR